MPLFVFLGPIIGSIYLLTPFGIHYAAPVVILNVYSVLFWKHDYKRTALSAALAGALGAWSSFFSWLLSRREINSNEAMHAWPLPFPSIAKSGFPIEALELPQPPLGKDMVPNAMMHGALLNNLIWLLVGLAIATIAAYFTPKQLVRYQLLVALGALGTLGLLYNFSLFMLWFD